MPKKSALKELEIIFEESEALSRQAMERVQEQAVRDIFGPGANAKRRYVASTDQISEYSKFLKGLGLKIVYTLGVWDLPHIGHCRYLEAAKGHGDILVVGVELDEAISIRKGENRPVVPFRERVEMLCHIRHIDLVVPIPDYDRRGLSGLKMLSAIQPDTFVVSERSFKEASDTAEWIKRAKSHAGNVIVLDSMAETSTSAKIRGLLMDMGEYAKRAVNEAQRQATKALEETFTDVKARIDEVIRKA